MDDFTVLGGRVVVFPVDIGKHVVAAAQSVISPSTVRALVRNILDDPADDRPLLARYARLFAPGLHVLSYNEVPENREVSIIGTVG